jgi:hypothetical protein
MPTLFAQAVGLLHTVRLIIMSLAFSDDVFVGFVGFVLNICLVERHVVESDERRFCTSHIISGQHLELVERMCLASRG